MAINPIIKCKDGFTISVQASETHYCEPRSDVGPYTHYECGFPSSKPLDRELLECADLDGDDDDYRFVVYPWTPREAIERELELHGGIVEGSLPGIDNDWVI